MLVRGAYNDSEEIHKLMELVFELAEGFDAAVIVAAHPRKQGGREDDPVSLIEGPEAFFESCMGSSHFINSTGSLWGIERNAHAGYSYLVLGSKRVTGNDAFTTVELNDDDWFKRVDDLGLAEKAVNNTTKRQEAWILLPNVVPFSYTEAWNSVRKALPYKNSFSPWWSELRRNKLIVPTLDVKDNRYQKAKVAPVQNKSGTPKGKPKDDGKAKPDPLTGILPGTATVDSEKLRKDREAKARVQ